ncbi:hypothetical protein V1514DRAFT_334417, partial [Lipomyces japonicus]|uniref:uncharacterized protein n=1 Tax=Lipomyces japonicus TaxID=56871 RepID=UPI0034CD9F8C
MSSFEDNNPFAGAGHEVSVTDAEDLQTTDHFATVIDSAADDDNDHDAANVLPPNGNNYYDPSVNGGIKHPYSSRIEQLLVENPDLEILITDAGKNLEGSSGGFISYTIRTGELAVRRRYSEFESLRNSLTRLFPTLIVPPIPEKHTMSDYAAAPTKAKEDHRIIDHRRRMLAVFLNRCRTIKQIRESIVFQRFLDPNVSWSEVLVSYPLTSIPKYVLRAPPLKTYDPSPDHAYLPVPSSSTRLKNDPEPEFNAAETKAKEYESTMQNGIERVNKRIIKRYGEISADLSELGARYNAWSLNEVNTLANAIEKTGQAVDGTYIATEELITSLSSSFSEPLSESAQFAAIVRSVLKYRHQKALQHDMTLNSLAVKKNLLAALEQTEMESQRINDYLQNRDNGYARQEALAAANENVKLNSTETLSTETTDIYAATDDNEQRSVGPEQQSSNEPDRINHDNSEQIPYPPPPQSQPQPPPARRINGLGGGGFKIPGIGKLNEAIHGIIDADPETTRRNNIGKTREQLQILERSLEITTKDLSDASGSVKADLARYQQSKEQDLRKIMIAYGRCHIEWARKSLEAWEEAKEEIEKIKL